MRSNRPQSLHSNTNWQPLPKNAGTYLSKPFGHPNTNQNSGSNPSILRKSFAKASSFFLKHGVNGGKQGLFFSQRLHFLSPSCGRCMLHGRSLSRRPIGRHLHCAWRTKKRGAIRKGSGQLPFRGAGCPSQPPLSSPSPLVGRRSSERGDTKTPAARKHSADRRFSRRGRKSKK